MKLIIFARKIVLGLPVIAIIRWSRAIMSRILPAGDSASGCPLMCRDPVNVANDLIAG